MTGSIAIAQVGLGMAGVAAAAWIVSIFLQPDRRSTGSVDLLMASLFFVLLYGHHYSDLPLWMACVFAATPLAAWVTDPLRKNVSPAALSIVRIVAMLLPAIIVFVIAAINFQAAMESNNDEQDNSEIDYYSVRDASVLSTESMKTWSTQGFPTYSNNIPYFNGADRDRTCDLLHAKH